MKILWFTWKDRKNPVSGGAEIINEKIARMAAEAGHEIVFIVAGFPGAADEEMVDGYRVIRVGNRWSVYWQAYQEYKRNWQGWADVVIEEVNTIPFFTRLYVSEKRVLLIYQLCREIWFYQMIFPINLLGYLSEPLYLRLILGDTVLTESKSTKKDLQKHGFLASDIQVFPIALESDQFIKTLSLKNQGFSVLSLGALRPMKRTLDQIKAFEIFADSQPGAEFFLAGDISGKYGAQVLDYISRSRWKKRIHVLGSVSAQVKRDLMQKCHVVLMTSVKEGWGLVVTEANALGTPAVVYDVDGLRDSAHFGKTGLIVPSRDISALAQALQRLAQDDEFYKKLQKQAYAVSQRYTPEKMYTIFMNYISKRV